jgi:hypothetical protein
VVPADDTGIPPRRRHLGIPENEVVEGGQPEHGTILAGTRRQQQRGAYRISATARQIAL